MRGLPNRLRWCSATFGAHLRFFFDDAYSRIDDVRESAFGGGGKHAANPTVKQRNAHAHAHLFMLCHGMKLWSAPQKACYPQTVCLTRALFLFCEQASG